MMVSVVKDKYALNKRLKRFFSKESLQRESLVVFLDSLAESFDVCIFGGVVRDIALEGISRFNGDIDVVVSPKSGACLDDVLIGASKNKFGGFRLKVSDWSVDVWELNNTWAFNNTAVESNGFESLLKTTITNWDAIYFDWSTKRAVCSDAYFKDLDDKYLDLVLEENPNPTGVLVRVLRSYAVKDAVSISGKLAATIHRIFRSVSVDELLEFESENYPENCQLNRKLIQGFMSQILESKEDLLEIELEIPLRHG